MSRYYALRFRIELQKSSHDSMAAILNLEPFVLYTAQYLFFLVTILFLIFSSRKGDFELKFELNPVTIQFWYKKNQNGYLLFMYQLVVQSNPALRTPA